MQMWYKMSFLCSIKKRRMDTFRRFSKQERRLNRREDVKLMEILGNTSNKD